MNEGWVKLWRSLKDNDVIYDDKASRLLLWLFVSVDRKTGSLKTGRYTLAREVRMKDPTLYRVLKRLEKKYEIVTITSNNKFTMITFINWAKYQAAKDSVTGISNNRVTTEEQQSNTITRSKEIKNKEYREIAYLQNIPLDDLEEFTKAYNCSAVNVKSKAEDLYNYCKAKGRKYSDYKAFLRNALKKDFGARLKVVTEVVEEPYEVISKEKLEQLRKDKQKLFGGMN